MIALTCESFAVIVATIHVINILGLNRSRMMRYVQHPHVSPVWPAPGVGRGEDNWSWRIDLPPFPTRKLLA